MSVCPRCGSRGTVFADDADLRCVLCGWYEWGYPDHRKSKGGLPGGDQLLARYAGPSPSRPQGETLTLGIDRLGKYLIRCPYTCGLKMQYSHSTQAPDHKRWYGCQSRHWIWVHDRHDDDKIHWG
jgi:hypothetical protein